MKSTKIADQRFMLVASAESIAQIRSSSSYLVMREMREKNIPQVLRDEYGVLHTQPLDDNVRFVAELMERRSAEP